MWFRSTIPFRVSRRPVPSVPQSRQRPTARLRVEALENRSLLSGTVTLAPSDGSPLVGEPVTRTATAVDVGEKGQALQGLFFPAKAISAGLEGEEKLAAEGSSRECNACPFRFTSPARFFAPSNN